MSYTILTNLDFNELQKEVELDEPETYDEKNLSKNKSKDSKDEK